MQEMSRANEGKHIPFKQEGWGFGLFVCLLAIATAGGAYYVHYTTFKQPTDVRFHAVGTGGGAAHPEAAAPKH